MEAYFYIIILLAGLALGSFFNVIIFRFQSIQKQGFWKPLLGRSKCLSCSSVIRWLNLIPVLSYLMLRGRCRKCSAKISPLYPIVEVTTAVVLVLLFFNAPTISYLTGVNAIIVLLLTLITFTDIRYLIIPDKMLVLLAGAVVGSKLLANNTDFYWMLISAFGLTLFFAILYVVSRGRWIGLGDIKLIFIIGFLLGYPMGYLTIVTAIWLAAIFSIALLLTKKATAKTEIPFGSFLSAATIIFITFNNELQTISKYFI